MSVRGQFFVAWAIGFPALLLGGEVDERFGALLTISGLLITGIGLRILLNDADWRRTAGSMRPRGGGLPDRAGRFFMAFLFLAIGLAWTFGGVLGVLAILGVRD